MFSVHFILFFLFFFFFLFIRCSSLGNLLFFHCFCLVLFMYFFTSGSISYWLLLFSNGDGAHILVFIYSSGQSKLRFACILLLTNYAWIKTPFVPQFFLFFFRFFSLFLVLFFGLFQFTFLNDATKRNNFIFARSVFILLLFFFGT